MESPPTTNIIKLAKVSEQGETNPDTLVLAQRWRSFRHHALQTAPEAFAASYETESQQGIGKTIEHLSNSKATHFVALSTTSLDINVRSRTGQPESFEMPWAGTIVLLGPLTSEGSAKITARKDPFSKVVASDHVAGIENSALQPEEDGRKAFESMHFHLNGMFVDATARGQGLGLALIQAALTEAAKLSRKDNSKSFKATILVDDYNTAARRLYEKAGFVVVGQEVYQQQPRVLVQGEEGRTERVALLMEYEEVLSHALSDY